ncbi:hypothetical protein [Maribellus maritimus]|uniref:hypothetical protein n=1 Tax=Maribellus maritimus TaxID=2870838 RepID=UPI001EECED66|nr:hypothetical protein [Maribellus maritimus]MCG6189829.1 hypothetical protein [Maribellus maritimus]
MRTRNTLWGILALVAVLGLSSFLPGPKEEIQKAFRRSPETRANAITSIMKNRLDLTETQVEKAYQINLKYAQKLQPFVGGSERPVAISDEATKINEERKKELLAILTPVQREQADQIRKQWISRLETILERLKQNDFKN